MQGLANMIAARQMVNPNILAYYVNFFSEYPSTELFEIYDIDADNFVNPPGKDSSQIMNRQTLCENLAEMDSNGFPMGKLIVLLYNEVKISFDNPLFIGGSDSYDVKHNK